MNDELQTFEEQLREEAEKYSTSKNHNSFEKQIAFFNQIKKKLLKEKAEFALEREEFERDKLDLQRHIDEYNENKRRITTLVKGRSKVKLNIGGSIFTTTIQALTSDAESFFTGMFSEDIGHQPDDDGEYFIDRNPGRFDIILDFLRGHDVNEQIKNLHTKDLKTLRADIDFYNLPSMNLLLSRLGKITCLASWRITQTEPIFIWTEDMKLITTIHIDTPFSMCRIVNSDTIATRHDTNIKLWSISTNTCKGTINVAVKENMSVLDVNTLATLNSDNVVQVWNVSTQACMATIQPGRQINHMRKFSDTLVACFTGQWEVWSIKTQQVAGIISFFSAVPSSFGGYVAVSRQKEISVFKASTLECVKIFTTDHTASIRVVRMIDEGTVASGGDDGIKIWNIETQECTASLVGHSAPVRQIIMLDQITLVSSSTDEVVKFWNIQTQQCVNTVAIGHTYLTDIA